jgi:hypothetical protein
MRDDLVSYGAIVLEDIVGPGVGCLGNLFSNGLFPLLAQFQVYKTRRVVSSSGLDRGIFQAGSSLDGQITPQGTRVMIKV